MGIDWWRNDPMLNTSAEQGLDEENRQLRATRGGARGRRREAPPMAEHGRYLFAVARGLDPAALAGRARAADGAPLDLVEHRGLQAVVCDVDLADFGEEALTRNLEDLAWLEEVARGHDDVVRAVAGTAPIAPMRLVTICADDESVRRPHRAVVRRPGAPPSTASRVGASGV